MLLKLMKSIILIQVQKQNALVLALKSQIAQLQATNKREREDRVCAENALALAREEYWHLHMKYATLQSERLRDMRLIQDARGLIGAKLSAPPPSARPSWSKA